MNDGGEPRESSEPLDRAGSSQGNSVELPQLEDRVTKILAEHPFGAFEEEALRSLGATIADAPLIRLKRQAEELLIRQAGAPARGAAEEPGALASTGNIVGVAYAASEPGVNPPGQLTLDLYVAEHVTAEAARNVLSSKAAAKDEDLRLFNPNIVVTGPVECYGHSFVMRPAPAGVSIGTYSGRTGTIGFFAIGRSGERASNLLIVSNNHILTGGRSEKSRKFVYQPSAQDGGGSRAYRIAELERAIPLDFSPGGTNVVDCATAWVEHGLVRRDVIYIDKGLPAYLSISPRPVPPKSGMQVGKSGRTTGLTQGRIKGLAASINIKYPGGRTATFVDQVSIVGCNSTEFSKAGDSGALIWTYDAARNPVALVVGGGDFKGAQTTFACKIGRVCEKLDIEIVVDERMF